MVRVAVLGPVSVTDEHGAVVGVTARQNRAVVSWLAWHAGEVVSIESLVEVVWGESAGRGAYTDLQRLVHRLRKMLGREAIETVGSGYRLRIEPSEVDVARFEAAARRGLAAREVGDAPAAVAAFDEALSLWRGRPLPDVADDSPAAASAIRWAEELRDEVVEARFEVLLELGAGGELAADIRQEIDRNEFREGLWGQWMRALYRGGRQAAALEAYDELAGLLAEHLDAEPSPTLQKLVVRLKRQDPDLLPQSTPPADADGPEDLSACSATGWIDLFPPGGFVGRARELDALGEAWSATLQGRRRLVLLCGEAGIGKTRLAARFAYSLLDEGALVLFGRCDDGLGAAYQPWSQALDGYAACVPVGVLRGQVGDRGPLLARVAPGLTDRIGLTGAAGVVEPETEEHRTFDAVRGLLDAIAADVPVLVVLDDLHWASPPTLRLLHHLLRSATSARLAVVGTYRGGDLAAGHPLRVLLPELRRTERLEHLSLGGLSAAETADLVRLEAGHDLDETLAAAARALHHTTGGNPYFAVQTLRYLQDTEVLHRRDGRLTADTALTEIDLPSGVREVMGLRLRHLPDRDRDLLAAAAVLGLTFDTALLARITGGDRHTVLDAIDAGITAGAIVHGDDPAGVEFTHDGYRQVLLDGLGAARRAELHWAAATVLAADAPTALDEIAHHAYHGLLAGDLTWTADVLLRAGQDARRNAAYGAALRHLERAADLARRPTVPPPLRAAVLVERALARYETTRPDEPPELTAACEAAEQAAFDLGDPDLIVRIATLDGLLNPFPHWGYHDQRRIAMVRRALQAVGPDHPGQRARLLAHLAALLLWNDRDDELAGLCDEADQLLDPTIDPRTADRVYSDALLALADPTHHVQARTLLERAERRRLPHSHLNGLLIGGFLDGLHGDVDALNEKADRLATLARQLPANGPTIGAALLAALRAHLTGDGNGLDDWMATLEPIEQRSTAAKDGVDAGRLHLAAYHALWLQHEVLQAADGFEMIARNGPALTRDTLFAGACMFHALSGPDDDNRRATRRFAAHPERWMITGVGWLLGVAPLADAVVRLGVDVDTAPLARRLETVSGLFVANIGMCVGPVDLYLGRLALHRRDHDRARHFLDRARHQCHTRGLDAWEAMVMINQARLAASDHRPDTAQALLGEAEAVGQRLGLPRIAIDAAAARTEHGLDP